MKPNKKDNEYILAIVVLILNLVSLILDISNKIITWLTK
nr:MAG TPA: hypothetical protein [Caudoviricetes sp.]